MMNVVVVMIGGFLGAIFRYLVGEWLPTSHGFPTGTLLVNVIGCLLLGWLLSFIANQTNVNPKVALFLSTGIIGSFTTFSTFSIEVIHLVDEGKFGFAIIYVSVSILGGLLFSYCGNRLANIRTRVK